MSGRALDFRRREAPALRRASRQNGLCWFPAGEIPAAEAGRPPRTSNWCKSASVCSRVSTGLRRPASIPCAFERDVFGQRETKCQRVAVAIFGHEADGLGRADSPFATSARPGERSQRALAALPPRSPRARRSHRRESRRFTSRTATVPGHPTHQYPPRLQRPDRRSFGTASAAPDSASIDALRAADSPRRASRSRDHPPSRYSRRRAARLGRGAAPSRRPAILNASSSLCVMRTTEFPSSANCRSQRNNSMRFSRREDRCWLVEYGIRVLRANALTISSRCCPPTSKSARTCDRVEDQSASSANVDHSPARVRHRQSASSAERDVLRDGHRRYVW